MAAPADRSATAAVGDTRQSAVAGDGSRRRSTRTAGRLHRAQLAALAALQAASSYSKPEVQVPLFFGRLTEDVARLVGARRAAFWRLGPDRTLAVQPRPYGFAAGSPVHELRIRLPDDGLSVIDRIVDGVDLDPAEGTSSELDEFWHANGLAGVRRSMAVSWRCGDRAFGILAAYDPRRGFGGDDVWLLRLAALATGLMWRYTEVEHELQATAERLENAAAARRQLLANIAAGGDEARRRFASALHDDTLQLLTAAELQLERARAEAGADRQTAQLDEVAAILKRVEDSLRRLLMTVGPTGSDLPLGLDEAIRTRLEALRTRTGIEPDVDVRIPEQLPDAIGAVILKNVSEALSNAEKHANATSIRVSAHAVNGGIHVEVADDGKGFVVAESVDVPGHFGLVAIRERAQMAGGTCHIASDPGAGARVEFWVPTSL